jgi:hypothetical protein
MSFLVSLAHFVGWVILVPALIYLIVSFIVALYANNFWYKKNSYGLCTRKQYAYQVGFKNLWEWFADILDMYLRKVTFRHLLKQGLDKYQISNQFGDVSPYEVEYILGHPIFLMEPFFWIAEYRYDD